MYHHERIVKSKLKCPKCKGNSLVLTEIWTSHLIEWTQTNGMFDRNDGVLNEGEPKEVEARCKTCAHNWKVRKAKQIDDITE